MTTSVLLNVGDTAPQASLPDQNNHLFSLPAQNGKWMVIYFFPKAMTSGCTVQAKDMDRIYQNWQAAGVDVVGISAEPVKRQQAFAAKEDLNHPLLADHDHSVAASYGVWQEKSMYGRKYMGVQRTTYIVAPDGKIAHVIAKATPATHTKDIAAWFSQHTTLMLTA